MAIDSAEKRRSAAGVPFLPMGPGVTPNALRDEEWRWQAAWSYSGVVIVLLPRRRVLVSDRATTRVEPRDYQVTMSVITGSGGQSAIISTTAQREATRVVTGDRPRSTTIPSDEES